MRVCHCVGHLTNPGGACCQDLQKAPSVWDRVVGGLLPFCDACGRMTPPELGETCADLPGCIMRPLGTVEHPSA